MKAVLAAIALVCLSTTVLAHDIYSNLRDREGHLCCGGQDCKPVQATVLPDGNYYLPETGEIIPAEMATPSPDNRFHHCVYYPMLQCSSTGLDQYLKARPRLDASLLQCVLRSSCCNGEIDPIAKMGGMRDEK